MRRAILLTLVGFVTLPGCGFQATQAQREIKVAEVARLEAEVALREAEKRIEELEQENRQLRDAAFVKNQGEGDWVLEPVVPRGQVERLPEILELEEN